MTRAGGRGEQINAHGMCNCGCLYTTPVQQLKYPVITFGKVGASMPEWSPQVHYYAMIEIYNRIHAEGLS
jgi:hypothetical protein